MTVKANQKTLYRQIDAQFQGKRHIPFVAMDFEKRHGRTTTWGLSAKEAPEHIKANWPGSTWIVQVVTTTETRKGTSSVRHLFITSIRTTPEALLRLIRQRLPGVNYVGGSRQLRRRVGAPNPLPWQGVGARHGLGLVGG